MAVAINGSGTISGVPGAVLQVVQGTTTTAASTSTAAWSDTTLSATITPSSTSSKILVMATQNFLMTRSSSTDVSIGRVGLVRASTTVWDTGENRFGFMTGASGNLNHGELFNLQYLDSPATASAVTYKTQMWCSPVGTMYANVISGVTCTGILILMEIAA